MEQGRLGAVDPERVVGEAVVAVWAEAAVVAAWAARVPDQEAHVYAPTAARPCPISSACRVPT